MKNFKKLSRETLKTLTGGLQACYYLQDGTLYCPCRPGYHKCDGICIPNNMTCIGFIN